MNATATISSASSAATREVGSESIVQRLERNAERNPNGIGYATRTESSGTKVKQFTWKQYADSTSTPPARR